MNGVDRWNLKQQVPGTDKQNSHQRVEANTVSPIPPHFNIGMFVTRVSRSYEVEVTVISLAPTSPRPHKTFVCTADPDLCVRLTPHTKVWNCRRWPKTRVLFCLQNILLVIL